MTEEEIAAAMDELKIRADEMAARLDAGEDFEELCVEYANEAQQDTYGGEEEGSLTEEGTYYGAPTAIADWLFDESRQEGEIAVLESESLNRYYVVQFLSRQNDEEATNESIRNLLSQRDRERTCDGDLRRLHGNGCGRRASLSDRCRRRRRPRLRPLKRKSSETESAEAESTAAETAETETGTAAEAGGVTGNRIRKAEGSRSCRMIRRRREPFYR